MEATTNERNTMSTIYRIGRQEKNGTIRMSGVIGNKAQAQSLLKRVGEYRSTAEAWLETSEVVIDWNKVEA